MSLVWCIFICFRFILVFGGGLSCGVASCWYSHHNQALWDADSISTFGGEMFWFIYLDGCMAVYAAAPIYPDFPWLLLCG